jgi:cellulose biosynthesis protein BcsQ
LSVTVLPSASSCTTRDLLAGRPYDFVLIDTPPRVGVLSSLVLIAARWVIVPARPADFDVAGAVRLADLIDHELAAFTPACGSSASC